MGEVLDLEKIAPLSCVVGGFNTGALEAIPPAITPKPHNLVSVCMTLAPAELPPLCEGPRCVPVNKNLCCLFKRTQFLLKRHTGTQRMPGFLVAFSLTWVDEIPTDFHC